MGQVAENQVEEDQDFDDEDLDLDHGHLDDEDEDEDDNPSKGESNGGEGGSEDDERLIAGEENEGGETEEEREAIRAFRRQRRADRKQRQREREESLRREIAARDRIIADQGNRLNIIERRSNGTDLAQIDNAINQLSSAYNQVQHQLKEATESQDGAAVVQATESMFKIRERARELTQLKQAVQQQTTKPPALDPRLAINANSWMGSNNWYKPEGRDRDSAIVRRIDSELAQENWDPVTPEYWEELTERVKKELPHRFELSHNANRSNTPKLKKPIVMGSGANNSRGNPGTPQKSITLSKERIEAMREAGIWDNPKLRAMAIKEYTQHDKQTKSS